MKLFFFFLCLHFSLAFHSIFAGVQAKVGGPSSSLCPSYLKFCFVQNWQDQHTQLCLEWYLSFLGMPCVLVQEFCQCQRMAFGISLISGVAVQCTWTVPLWYIRVILKQLFTNYLQSRFRMWQRLGYGWTGNYRCNCVWPVTLCHLL